ncbi:MAG: S1C family serine protease [Gemmataceae bacterium]|nr:S1C family serine protease [Gemmataceae bacterium]
MTHTRPTRRLAITWSAAALLAAPGAALAAESGWDTGRATAPASVADLKALQDRVKGVVAKCSSATVGLFIGAGAGSGVIVSEDGLILTAAHVAGDKAGRDCTIILPDGKQVKGKTLGYDPKLDSGMVKITDPGPDDGKWPYLPVGKSAGLKKGQWVVALGHPGGWRKGRAPVARLGQVQRAEKGSLSTNCTLVGGDSGGPLFDLDGNVIGIHSQIAFQLDNNIHVPADVFKDQWDQLVAGEHVGRPFRAYLGVVFDDEWAEPGARLKEVDEGPGADAGLLPGDVIVKFDGTAVDSADATRTVLRKTKPGATVEVVVRRGTETLTKTVTLGKRAAP